MLIATAVARGGQISHEIDLVGTNEATLPAFDTNLGSLTYVTYSGYVQFYSYPGYPYAPTLSLANKSLVDDVIYPSNDFGVANGKTELTFSGVIFSPGDGFDSPVSVKANLVDSTLQVASDNLTFTYIYTPTSIPEPSSFTLALMSAIILCACTCRRMRCSP
jgi:hypothetical protein